jgi:GT2 family glycosyltransferase
MGEVQLGVVIPTYAAGSLLEKSIASIRRCEARGSIRATVTVVDNHPLARDKDFARLADAYISLPSNPGFGAAANNGITHLLENSEIDYVMLLNPDAYLAENFFEVLHQILKNRTLEFENPISPLICLDLTVNLIDTSKLFGGGFSRIEIVDLFHKFLVFDKTGKGRPNWNTSTFPLLHSDYLVLKEGEELISELTYLDFQNESGEGLVKTSALTAKDFIPDSIIQNAGSEIFSPTAAGDLNFGWLTSAASKHLGGPRRAWCGAGVILPRSYINRVGPFDTSFFLYYEDTEVSFRGMKIQSYPILQPDLRIFHQHSALTNTNPGIRDKSIWRSRQIFATRVAGSRYSFLYAMAILTFRIFQVITKRTTLRHFIHAFYPEILNTFRGAFLAIRPIPKFRRSRIK